MSLLLMIEQDGIISYGELINNNSNHRIWVNGKEQDVSQDPVNYDYGMNRLDNCSRFSNAIWRTVGNSMDGLMAEVHQSSMELYIMVTFWIL